MTIWTVSQVAAYLKRMMDQDASLASIFVRGEISNFKKHSTGHCYFTLKDNTTMIKSVMFRSRAQLLKFQPENGMSVIACGHITVFERDGQYQLYVDKLTPDGVGELALAYEQLKGKLSEEGLFDASLKRELPFFPRTIGIVTSPTGAALRDIITVAKRRHPGIRLILYPVQVQGDEAPSQIVRAIHYFNEREDIDVLIAGRGGGSLEELWAFNTEVVVRAVAASKIPIVSAVGHQTDFTLSDFAADLRAATPSQAAEIVVPDIWELSKYIRTLQSQMEGLMRNRVKHLRACLDRFMFSQVLKRPKVMLEGKQQIVDILIERIKQTEKRLIIEKQHKFKLVTEKLAALSPLAVMSRGYSIIQTKHGQIIKHAADTAVGDNLIVNLSKGELEVNVIAVREEFFNDSPKKSR